MAFPRFADLPAELRILVWNLVSFPDRVIGMVPYERGPAPSHAEGEKGSSVERDGVLPHFVQIVQPSHLGVFPPLHVNREARSVWLPRLVQPKRSHCATVSTDQADGSRSSGTVVLVRFSDPFINYDSDIFAVFGAWRAPAPSTLASTVDGHVAQNILPIDPFLGLDRSCIRRVGLSELSHGLESAVYALAIQQLPVLEQLAFIALGPDTCGKAIQKAKPNSHLAVATHGLEMRVEDLQETSCDIWNINPLAVKSQGFFNLERLRNQAALSPAIRPLPKYAIYVKALLWHAMSGNLPPNLHLPELIETRFDLLEYVFHGTRHAPCPMPAEDCHIAGHGRGEMLDWHPGFHVVFTLLCDRNWSSTAIKMGLVCS